ncbi:hypothetical protein [Pseudomonas putida]|uniref:SAM-dependent methyltransferase n=1 Tax=Pseudomonas putida TaxID=303 RepID=A0A8I1EBA9_PSEPU|nr:hypothetical protein [Pseudomonas putida]MBI6882620.1 hypothetical protein [Pseudomonas putida]
MSLNYNALPDQISAAADGQQRDEGLFLTLSKPLIDSLAKFFEGKRVLECYAGRGHLSAILQEKGVDIKTTSLQMGHDRSENMGYAFDVEVMSVKEAVSRYHDWMDVLLVAWPITDESLYCVLPYLPKGCPIVFIGEVTDYNAKPPFLGGCATDNFFDAVRELPELTAQLEYPTLRRDQIKVLQYAGSLKF